MRLLVILKMITCKDLHSFFFVGYYWIRDQTFPFIFLNLVSVLLLFGLFSNLVLLLSSLMSRQIYSQTQTIETALTALMVKHFSFHLKVKVSRRDA